MEFIEAPAFTRHIARYLTDDSHRNLQSKLAANPGLGDVMPSTGWFRKLRFPDSRRGKGRRGGLRIIYYYFQTDRQVWLITLYDKDEVSDRAPKERSLLKGMIEGELRAREAQRLVRKPDSRRT
jgi:hypothetical protein